MEIWGQHIYTCEALLLMQILQTLTAAAQHPCPYVKTCFLQTGLQALLTASWCQHTYPCEAYARTSA